MAKPVAEQTLEVLFDIRKQSATIIEQNDKSLEMLRFVGDKAAAAELRQCQHNAQSTQNIVFFLFLLYI